MKTVPLGSVVCGVSQRSNVYLPMPMLLISLLDSAVAGSRINVQVNVHVGTYICGVDNTSFCCQKHIFQDMVKIILCCYT